MTNPLALVRRPRLDEESPTLGLDRDEARAFLSAAAAAGDRDQLLALLLLHNGLRVSEACGARVEDLDVDRSHRVLRGAGKAGKRWTATLTPTTVAVLDRYLAGRAAGPVLLDNTATTGLDRPDATRIVRRARPPGRAHPETVTALDATHLDHLSARRRRVPPGCAGLRPPHRPTDHLPLRPGPAQPRPQPRLRHRRLPRRRTGRARRVSCCRPAIRAVGGWPR